MNCLHSNVQHTRIFSPGNMSAGNCTSSLGGVQLNNDATGLSWQLQAKQQDCTQETAWYQSGHHDHTYFSAGPQSQHLSKSGHVTTGVQCVGIPAAYPLAQLDFRI